MQLPTSVMGVIRRMGLRRFGQGKTPHSREGVALFVTVKIEQFISMRKTVCLS